MTYLLIKTKLMTFGLYLQLRVIAMFRKAVFLTHTDVIQYIMYALNFFILVLLGPVVSFGIWCAI